MNTLCNYSFLKVKIVYQATYFRFYFLSVILLKIRGLMLPTKAMKMGIQ